MKCFFSTLQENYPKLSANVAGDRKFDVYMGIDVFGRNTFGGGQWNVSIFLQQIPFLFMFLCLVGEVQL